MLKAWTGAGEYYDAMTAYPDTVAAAAAAAAAALE